jgi:hypothetical protein
MSEQVLFERGHIVVRRQLLEIGEATPWHIDPCERVTVVLSGEALAIEYRDGGTADRVTVSPGQTDWDEPSLRSHRAVNIGSTPYEEITVMFVNVPDADRQPKTSPGTQGGTNR